MVLFYSVTHFNNQRESGIDPLTFQLVDELIVFLIKCSVDVHMWL